MRTGCPPDQAVGAIAAHAHVVELALAELGDLLELVHEGVQLIFPSAPLLAPFPSSFHDADFGRRRRQLRTLLRTSKELDRAGPRGGLSRLSGGCRWSNL